MDPKEVLDAYTRAHWLVVADLEREVATLRQSSDDNRCTGGLILGQIENCIELLLNQICEYKEQHEAVMRDQDAATASRFLEKVRGTYSGKPEFAFLNPGKK